jgi:hypothetical protein
MIALVLWELNLHFSVFERFMVIISRLSCCISITPDFSVFNPLHAMNRLGQLGTFMLKLPQ